MTRQNPHMISDEAAAWIARMDAGQWTDADEDELQAWLKADPRRAGALLQMQALWTALDDADPHSNEENGTSGSFSPVQFNRRAVFAGGGAALAASLIGGVIWVRSAQRYQTEIGEIRRVPLKDGSVAAINTMSRIEVKLVDARREILIDQGEAWFQVAKDPERPFVVAAGRVRVQAVGTAFSVRKRNEGANIIVTEGTVEAWADGAEGAKVRLMAGEGAFVANNAGVTRLLYGPGSADGALAWRAGKIELVGTTLIDAVEEFNRYNKRQIVIDDPMIGNELFDGVFSIDDPEGFGLTIKNSLNVPIDFSSPSQIRIGRVHQDGAADS